MSWSFNPGPSTGLGFSPFARRYSGNHCCFLFLRLLRCFSSPGTSLAGHVFTCRWQLMSAAGFPHSDTSASSLPYSFTELFAVWRVLLQFRVARHSPYALPYLISGSRVFRDVLFQELFFYCFLSLSYNLRFRPFLLCLFFLVAQFSKIDSSEKSMTSQN